MKRRLDLAEELTTQDILEEAVATVHRFKPEPLLSKTGTGSLSSASTEERAKEVERSMELTRKLEERAKRRGKGDVGTCEDDSKSSSCLAGSRTAIGSE